MTTKKTQTVKPKEDDIKVVLGASFKDRGLSYYIFINSDDLVELQEDGTEAFSFNIEGAKSLIKALQIVVNQKV